jgi:hypothetical protein
MFLPLDEAILKEMTYFERLWEDMHHNLYFILELDKMEVAEKYLIIPRDFHWYESFIPTCDVYAEGNIENISKTIPIDISIKPSIIENVMLGTCFILMKLISILLSSRTIVTFFLVHMRK